RQRMTRNLVTGADSLAQEHALRVGVARDRKEHTGDSHVAEQLEDPRDGLPVDDVTRLDVIESVTLQMAVHRVDVAGEDRVRRRRHRRVFLNVNPATARCTALAMWSTGASSYDAHAMPIARVGVGDPQRHEGQQLRCDAAVRWFTTTCF